MMTRGLEVRKLVCAGSRQLKGRKAARSSSRWRNEATLRAHAHGGYPGFPEEDAGQVHPGKYRAGHNDLHRWSRRASQTSKRPASSMFRARSP